jgi:hypothetical protein
VVNDPVNLVDPFGLKWKCPQINGEVVVCGSRRKTTPTAAPFNAGPTGNNGPVHGPGGSRGSRKSKPAFTCADALREPGKIKVSGTTGGLAGALGWSVTHGSWENLQTGTKGSFTSYSFLAGVEAGVGPTEMIYTSVGAFTGWSDTFTIGGSGTIPGLPVSLGLSYNYASNDSGSGSGLSAGITPGAPWPFISLTGGFGETYISRCRAGGL